MSEEPFAILFSENSVVAGKSSSMKNKQILITKNLIIKIEF
jgi:hypothetical protein